MVYCYLHKIAVLVCSRLLEFSIRKLKKFMGFFKKQFVLTEPVIKNIRRLVELREPKRKKKPMLFMAKWQICASFVVKALLLAVQAIGSGEV